MPNYTEQQERAILTRGHSLALDAGAGCGKTFVLTERYLKELENPGEATGEQRLHQLVAITFTDAAARELRTRIRGMIYERLRNAPSEQREYWLGLQRAIDGCRISTIHSLCTSILRANAFEASLDPLFTTLDGPASMVLVAEAIEDTLRELLADRDEDAMRLGGVWDLNQLQGHVSTMLWNHSRPEFTDWCNRTPAEQVAVWKKYYEEVVWPDAIGRLLPDLEALVELLRVFPAANAAAQDIVYELENALLTLRDGRAEQHHLASIEELCRVAKKENSRAIPFLKAAWRDDDRYEAFRDYAKLVREGVRELPVFSAEHELTHEFSELGLSLARVANKAAKCYQAAKEELGALDFEDLLTKTHQLLTDPAHREVQRRLQSDISLLFIDEFQDTDRVQVEMVRSLVGDIVGSGKLFFVGDEKQSIYRFRGAEPRVFKDLQEEIDEDWRLPLSINFRSQPAILNFVNALFEPLFSRYQALEASRPQATPQPAIEFLWTDTSGLKESGGRKAGQADRARRAEARTIAARLREMIDGGEPMVADKQNLEGRAAQYGDIAILFRALSDVAFYEEALRAEGIPYYLVGGHAFYTQQEIYDVLHLLRVVISECDELSLAGVLRSPLFSLADETIFWLSTRHRSLERGLFAKVLPREVSESERQKVIRAAETISLLRQHRDDWSVPKLLNTAIERTGFDATLLADFMGERKLANIYKLAEQARAAHASGVGSLEEFVTQLDQFITSTPKESLATTSPDTANVVRLMTIHKSKGLEFPVVVLADLDRQANPNSSQVEYTPELGPLARPPKDDIDAAGQGLTGGLGLFKHIDNLAEREEIDRLFYVACTRAADYLLLSSGVADLEKQRGPFLSKLAERFALETGDLIEPDRVDPTKRPQVKVQVVEPLQAKSKAGDSTDWLKVLEKAARGSASSKIEQSARPMIASTAARRRFSVTRLSGQIIPSGGDWWRDDPESREPTPKLDYDPLGLGTLVHAVLERADLADAKSIAKWCKTLAPQHDLLHAETATSMAQELVERFADSPRAASLRAAAKLHHEVEFQLSWPVGSTDTDSRYLQGYIDCLYQAKDQTWCVLDYKTNQVTAEQVPDLAAKYELQMLVYGLAIEQTWGHGPSELVLHFLRPGVDFTFAWDDAARKRAIELVDAALAKIEESPSC